LSSTTSVPEFPNATARLRIARTGPGLPDRERILTIWLCGTRFRIRDESGAHVSSILDDVPGTRGLGTPLRTVEAMMDLWSEASKRPTRPNRVTELWGDLASDEGYVKHGDADPWPKSADELAPLAVMILAPPVDDRLHVAGGERLLDRTGTRSEGRVEGQDEDGVFETEVTRIVAPPYLLREFVRDLRDPSRTYLRELLSLEEGAVTDADLIPA
jgi:hypothetical protein